LEREKRREGDGERGRKGERESPPSLKLRRVKGEIWGLRNNIVSLSVSLKYIL